MRENLPLPSTQLLSSIMQGGNSIEDESASLQKVKCGRVYVHLWNGFWFWDFRKQAAQEVLNLFKPHPTDIILASFPKTGTTWLKALLFSIINQSSRNSILENHPQLLVPTLEIQLYGSQQRSFDEFPSTISNCTTRIFATHLPYQILANTISSSDCRVVYITRNPKDALVSMWKFANKSKLWGPWPLEEAQENFCNGAVPFGPYYDHVMGYKNESLKRPKKMFFITYEELKNDCKNHVRKLAEFLDYPFDDNEEVLDEIVSNCSYERMSNYEVNKSNDTYVSELKLPSSSFYRKGVVGDYKNYLNKEIIARIDAITRENFHGSDFIYGI